MILKFWEIYEKEEIERVKNEKNVFNEQEK